MRDPHAAAIYGYYRTHDPLFKTISNLTIINLANSNKNVNIAPGQGFFLANNSQSITHQISFTMAMRTSEGTDDFILGRNSNQNQKLKLRVADGSADFDTEFYYNANSTLGLDPGYDAAIYGGKKNELMLYSHLVKNDIGRNMAIQSFNLTDLNDLVIPLGLKASTGKQIIFSIEDFTLAAGSNVYLEDRKRTS